MSVLTAIVLGGLIAAVAAVFYCWGHLDGVVQTEKRWSEAVERAEWHRKYGAG